MRRVQQLGRQSRVSGAAGNLGHHAGGLCNVVLRGLGALDLGLVSTVAGVVPSPASRCSQPRKPPHTHVHTRCLRALSCATVRCVSIGACNPIRCLIHVSWLGLESRLQGCTVYQFCGAGGDCDGATGNRSQCWTGQFSGCDSGTRKGWVGTATSKT